MLHCAVAKPMHEIIIIVFVGQATDDDDTSIMNHHT